MKAFFVLFTSSSNTLGVTETAEPVSEASMALVLRGGARQSKSKGGQKQKHRQTTRSMRSAATSTRATMTRGSLNLIFLKDSLNLSHPEPLSFAPSGGPLVGLSSSPATLTYSSTSDPETGLTVAISTKARQHTMRSWGRWTLVVVMVVLKVGLSPSQRN